MCLINEDILCIGGDNSKGFYLIKISSHQLIKNIIGPKRIWSIHKCFDDLFLCSIINENGNNSIVKYKYKKQNLIKIFENENAHEYMIFSCIEMNDGIIISGGKDCLIKLWSN